MGKKRSVVLNGGGTGSAFTAIRVTRPAHLVKVFEDGTPSHPLTYQTIEDGFVGTYNVPSGGVITIRGNGRHGIVGRPPNYNALGVPANTAPATGDSGGGDIVLQVKSTALATPTVVVYESESQSEEDN